MFCTEPCLCNVQYNHDNLFYFCSLVLAEKVATGHAHITSLIVLTTVSILSCAMSQPIYHHTIVHRYTIRYYIPSWQKHSQVVYYFPYNISYYPYHINHICHNTIRSYDRHINMRIHHTQSLIVFLTDCGNQIYNPATQVCCCGKVHSKRRFSACCGYFYYDTRRSQCCRYYSVKPKKARCPRYTV